jgi:hypothetical protein
VIASPQNTIAIIVGIEEYDAGQHWRLDGPVPDACRFTSWLLSCGVPPANITLLAAPQNGNDHLVEAQRAAGVDVVDARADTVRDRFIIKLPMESSDLLLIHWGGHGVVDDRGERRLIYNDAVAHDRRNMNITGLLALLRTAPYRGHPCQRIIIDSCLTFARSVGWRAEMPNEEFQRNDSLPAVDQLTLFAASDGERARNDDVLQTGLFSRAVLESLAGLPSEQWPPDFVKVRDDVDIVLQARRAELGTRQVPSHVWFRRGSNDETVVFTAESDSGEIAFGASPARSRYRDEQVRRIAPRQLSDRAPEMEALHQFCTAADVPVPYQWWCAEAWAGKSALAASFVLDPPPRVRIVSFFITARWAGHDTRAAFVQIVLEQLAEVLNRAIPSTFEASRDLEFSGMLREAAAACSERGGHLVLVIDGLDEDSGIAGSIAALLPANAPPGLRVVVTGRPNPQLPADVPDDHPLRDPAVMRMLTVSAAARIAKVAMEREVDALLEGGAAERDLVGLVVAARGGLSGRDLAELMTRSPRQLDKVLNGPAGRSFTRRAADWRPETTPEVFLLAHENLQRAAEEELGEDELRKYRKRLHDWAEGYRLAGWPPETPQYLLNGFFSQLDAAAKALYAADPARHERLRAVSRSHAAALAEVVEAQDAISSAGDPDVPIVMQLAMHRESLSDRNARTLTRMPAVLAMLGDIDRAEALATAITDGDGRREMIERLIYAMVRAGNSQRAHHFVHHIGEREEPNRASVALAGALAEEGEVDQAETLASYITDRGDRAAAVAAIIERANLDLPRALALAVPVGDTLAVRCALVPVVGCHGDLTAALNLAGRIRDGLWRGCAIADLTIALAGRGDFVAAETVLRMTDGRWRWLATEELIKFTAAAGHFDRSLALIRDFADANRQHIATEALAMGLAAAGDVAGAQACLDGINDDRGRNRMFVKLIEQVDDVGWARALTELIPDSTLWLRENRAKANTALLKLMCRKGELTTAERLVPDTANPAEAYIVLAEAAITMGDLDRGRNYAVRAEAASRASGQFINQDKALEALAKVVVKAGDVPRAEALARLVSDPGGHRHRRVVELLAPLLAEAGEFVLAESFVRAERDQHTQLKLIIPLVRRLWQAGERERARDLTAQAQMIADNPRDSFLMPLVFEVLVNSGEDDRAIELVRSSGNDWGALPALVRVLGLVGNLDGAAALLNSFGHSYYALEAFEALAEVVGADPVHPLLGKIGDDKKRAMAMVAIAKHAEPILRKRLLTEAIELSHWTEPLLVLAQDDPGAALTIVDEYLAHWQPK